MKKYTEPFTKEALAFSWKLLCIYLPVHEEGLVYGTLVVRPSSSPDPDYDSEDEEESGSDGLEGLITQLVELVSTVVPRELSNAAASGQESELGSAMREFVWLLASYTLITKAEVERFAEDPNNFVAIDTDDSTGKSVRNICVQLIDELIRRDPGVTGVVMQIIESFMRGELIKGKKDPPKVPTLENVDYHDFFYESANPYHGMLKQETALCFFGRYAEEIREYLETQGADTKVLENMLANYVIPAINFAALTPELTTYADIFKYRGLLAASEILSELKESTQAQEFSKALLSAVYNILTAPGSSLAARLATSKLLESCSGTLSEISDPKPLQALALSLIRTLQESNSDTCGTALRGINELCKNKNLDTTPELAEQLFAASLDAFLKFHNECEVVMRVTTLCATLILGKSEATLLRIFPRLRAFVTDTIGVACAGKQADLDSDIIQQVLEIVTMSIVRLFRRSTPSPAAGAELQQVVDIVIKTMLTSDDVTFIMYASWVVRSYVAYAYNTIGER